MMQILFALALASAPQTDALLVRALDTIDSPFDWAVFKAANPDAEAALLRVAEGERVHRLVRQRALGLIDVATGRAVLLRALSSPLAPLRKTAAHTLRTLAKSDSEVQTRLTSLLDDQDVVVRKAAVRALAPLASARPALDSRLLKEQDKSVRTAIFRALLSPRP